MKTKPLFRALVILIVLSLNVGCDQISKKIVRERIEYNQQISLIGDYFTLTKIENTGAFLSFGHSLPQPLKLLLLIIIPMIAFGFAFYYLIIAKSLTKTTIAGICFVVGGGIGNIYDRIIYGSVTDFLHIDFLIFQTGIFNMADISIMIGMGLIVLGSYMNRIRLILHN